MTPETHPPGTPLVTLSALGHIVRRDEIGRWTPKGKIRLRHLSSLVDAEGRRPGGLRWHPLTPEIEAADQAVRLRDRKDQVGIEILREARRRGVTDAFPQIVALADALDLGALVPPDLRPAPPPAEPPATFALALLSDGSEIPEWIQGDARARVEDGLASYKVTQEGHSLLVMRIGDRVEVQADGGEVEDQIFGRDLAWIPAWIEDAYEAGRAGATRAEAPASLEPFHSGSGSVLFYAEVDGEVLAYDFGIQRIPAPPTWAVWHDGDLHDGFTSLDDFRDTFGDEVYPSLAAYRAGPSTARPIEEVIALACEISGVTLEALEAAEPGDLELEAEIYECQFCGEESRREPHEQIPPASTCAEEDHQ